MARSRKSSDKSTPREKKDGQDEAIEDAVVVEESAEGGEPKSQPEVESDTSTEEPLILGRAPDAPPDSDAPQSAGESGGAVQSPESAGGETLPEGDGAPPPSGVDDRVEMPATGTEEDRHAPAEPPAASSQEFQPVPVRSGIGAGGVIALVFGGVVAAGIGVIAALYIFPEGWPGQASQTEAAIVELRQNIETRATASETALGELGQKLDAQTARIAALEGTIDSVVASVGALENADPGVDALGQRLGSEIEDMRQALDAVTARLDAAETRVEEIALRPIPEALDATAIEAELTRFRSELSAAVEDARTEVANARSEIEAARTRAAEIETQAADEAARREAEAAAEAARREAEAAEQAAALQAEARANAEAAMQRAALARVIAALENGEPYAEPLSAFTDVPDALSAPAETGVATLVELQQSFPDAARAALDASIRAQVGGSALDRVAAFLRIQSGVRSLEPREGDDPDAVLSRAEAALRSGDVETALSEIESLPEAGRAAMEIWTAAARSRSAALAAAEGLSDTLSTN